MAAAFCGPVLRVAILASLQFGDSTVYVWSGIGPTTWNGMTFKGVGTLGSVSTISEDSTVEAKQVVFELSGIPLDLVAEVLYETRILLTAQAWLALFDASGTLIASPVLSYKGKMDEPTLSDDGQTCSIQISCEGALADLNRPCYRRYTNDDQQIDLAATLTRLGLPSTTIDTGFQYVPGIQERITFWGRLPSSTNNV